MRAIAIVILASFALAGCARSLSPDVYSRDEVGAKVEVEDAVVMSVRDVRIEGTRSNVSATAGAVAGGVGGAVAGGGRRGVAILGAVAGAIIGAVAGAAVEEAVTASDGVEYLVQLTNGDTVAVVQPKGEEAIAPGDHVLLVYGDFIRITPAPPGRSPPAIETPEDAEEKAIKDDETWPGDIDDADYPKRVNA